MNSPIYLFLIACLLMLLSACQAIDPDIATRPAGPTVVDAQLAEQSGDHANAAQQYIELALKNTNEQQAQFYLYAAQNFWLNNDVENAATHLANVNREKLSSAKHVDAAILEAEIAQYNSQAKEVLRALTSIDLNTLTNQQKRQVLEFKIQAYQTTENWLEKANSHISLAPLLLEYQQQTNQQMLWQALMNLTPQTLDLFNPGEPPAIDSGWFSLAYVIQAYQTNLEALTVALEDWRRSYSNHPANPNLYQTIIKEHTAQLLQNITSIAILLPESGPYKTAAAAIKEGIIAAHLTAQSNTHLHFFSVYTNKQDGSSDVLQQYQRAVDMQVNLVIGPLDKLALQLLAESDALPVPVLALNQLAYQTSKVNLFQFGLAPEDDAVAAANYATEQGFERAIVLAPENNWGERIKSAFIKQWQLNGGTILNQGRYDVNLNDFSDILKPLLGLSSSKQREQALIRTLGKKLEFEPRRRQDIDFAFLVAKPPKARQLVPQLKFYRSGSLPVIATSHAYTGYPDAKQDIDLNRVIINDMPWNFSDSALSDPTYIALFNSNLDNFKQMKRLYALGADAYHLVPELNLLKTRPELIYNGATGRLSIDQFGHISRIMPWGTFKEGLLEALPISNIE